MTRADRPSDTPAQPQLAELLSRYLHNQASAQAAGLAVPEMCGEVVPFEAAPVQPVDPRLAWDEAVAVVRFLHPKADARSWQAPPDWPNLVQSHEPAAALAFCLGNFPQLVRNLQPLLGGNLTRLRPTAGRPVAAPSLLAWANQVAEKQQYPQLLLARSALRLARQFEQAALPRKDQAAIPQEWRALWANEEAALAWHRGLADEALTLWQAQPESVPVLFNRGMASLFLGQPAAARSHLTRAVAQIPEESAWHHLGRLYLALAETRG